MINIIFQRLLILFLGVILISACSAPTAAPTLTPTTNGEILPILTITGVEVHIGEQITFTGKTTLAEGACLRSELTQDGDLVPWWPSSECFPVTGQTWQISVTLDTDGRPSTLDDEAQYQLRAWWDVDPKGVADVFYFDLASPPPGPSSSE